MNEPDLTPTNLYNPDLDEFLVVRADDKNEKHEYILPGLEVTTLPAWLAKQAANDLAEKLVWKRGVKTNYEDDKKAILKEIIIGEL